MKYFIESAGEKILNFDINKIFARFYNLRGTMSADEGKFKEALDYFNKAINLDPSFSIAFFNRGTIKADVGNFDEAKNDFRIAQRLDILPS